MYQVYLKVAKGRVRMSTIREEIRKKIERDFPGTYTVVPVEIHTRVTTLAQRANFTTVEVGELLSQLSQWEISKAIAFLDKLEGSVGERRG